MLIKLSIVVGAFYFIYQKLIENEGLEFSVFIQFLKENNVFSLKNIAFLIILSGFNWFFEFLKWRQLVSVIKKISLKESLEQSLGSLTASLITPNRIGEYGAKALYFSKPHRKRVLLLNFLGNAVQMSVTTILGCIGLILFVTTYKVDINYYNIGRFGLIIIVIGLFTIFGIKQDRFKIKGFPIHKIIDFVKSISTRIKAIVFGLSLIRYLIFSFQFYVLLHIFGIEVDYYRAMMVITSIYLLASVIPTIFIFDVVVKGSVAVYLFSLVGVNEISILCIITIMWLLNFVIPSLFGSYYVLNFNFERFSRMISILFIVTTLAYLLLIVSLIRGFNKVKPFELSDLQPKTKFSILIPFKDEAEHLPKLLDSIKTLSYPKDFFEIIFINDVSIDNSVEIIRNFSKRDQFNYQIHDNIRQSKSPKKDAITLGISKAKHDWIITTDADCILPKYWLDSFDEHIVTHQSDMLIAPVSYGSLHTFLERFQALDILSLQGTTIGAHGLNQPFMCNGANLAYRKSLFNELNGFEGNDTIASGDDVFFLEKAHKAKKAIHYLKTSKALVTTIPQPTWEALINQRKRWAAKTSATKNTFGKLTALIVLFMNLTLVCGVVLGFASILTWKLLFYTFFIKINIDFLLLYKTAIFLNKKEALSSYWLACLFYPFFSSFVAVSSIFSGYKWKGTRYSK